MPAYRPITDRLNGKLNKTGDCWLWTGATSRGGYGRIGTGGTATSQAHRVAYELWVGSIPDGMHIDHLCRNRACCKPDHLEAVTQAENNRRAAEFRSSHPRACKRGHSISGANAFIASRGGRQCRTCRNAGARARRRGMTVDEYLTMTGADLVALLGGSRPEMES